MFTHQVHAWKIQMKIWAHIAYLKPKAVHCAQGKHRGTVKNAHETRTRLPKKTTTAANALRTLQMVWKGSQQQQHYGFENGTGTHHFRVGVCVCASYDSKSNEQMRKREMQFKRSKT